MRLRYQSLVWAVAVLTGAGPVPTLARQSSEEPVPAPALHLTVITQPVWSRPPAPEYPERALSQGVNSGLVDLDCGFTADGALSACQITKESPSGMGFGMAALRGARTARLAPRTIDRVPADARVRFPVGFSQRP